MNIKNIIISFILAICIIFLVLAAEVEWVYSNENIRRGYIYPGAIILGIFLFVPYFIGIFYNRRSYDDDDD